MRRCRIAGYRQLFKVQAQSGITGVCSRDYIQLSAAETRYQIAAANDYFSTILATKTGIEYTVVIHLYDAHPILACSIDETGYVDFISVGLGVSTEFYGVCVIVSVAATIKRHRSDAIISKVAERVSERIDGHDKEIPASSIWNTGLTGASEIVGSKKTTVSPPRNAAQDASTIGGAIVAGIRKYRGAETDRTVGVHCALDECRPPHAVECGRNDQSDDRSGPR